MAIALREGTAKEALEVLQRLVKIEDQYDSEFEAIDIGPWPAIHVYLPYPEVNSSITPPFMEAFLELQRQLLQLAAQAKNGSPDSGLLSELDRITLEISVVVTGGSSDYSANLIKPIQGLLKAMIGKMTGKQAAVVLISFAVLIASTWSFVAWLEQRRAVQIEELKSKDHVEALRALNLSQDTQVETFKQVAKILESQGEIGKRAIEAIFSTNEALLKAASKTNETVINDTHLTKQEAELLRTTPKKKSEIRLATQRMRVLDINTSNPNELSVLISTPNKVVQHRIKFVDHLFSTTDDRKELLAALDSREPVWMDLAFRETDGEVKSVQLLRTREPPTLADSEIENEK